MKLLKYLTRLQAKDYIIWLNHRKLSPNDLNLEYFMVMEKIPFEKGVRYFKKL